MWRTRYPGENAKMLYILKCRHIAWGWYGSGGNEKTVGFLRTDVK